ncbi:carbohydrate ABC transporter permease [Rhizobium leguminosarum]|uniref:Binding-protein-dependent transport systems inner membrane component n=1 Tax=Rhizobium leguminosarum bv. trifolii (strain WSM1325) TaxID=395491 RepID=C6B5R2_RHILS|nr:sugar ABC transporter permease [Rhizobium leguminosarum]ACS59420.1 binding-protein-dependent transport systems inner membrane component [Rhizobium leguminosarum bv. trifolii WSM1325]MBY2919028.1 sugar ABC transporter permease [Rhizobium leguminosarum]MBY2974677.1 sugar ABC transporter permease [Rhizobium leguminosarum]MBY2982158.1 sugar ABC transporter permease [Rhizobium leguminosarum]MBY3010626.1 sugar ABC transporter permease [Rhizobium leguminosarum]
MNHSATALIAAHPKARRKGWLRYSTLRKLVPYFYVSPATLLLVLLMLFPMVMVFKYSLMDGAIMKKTAAFAGLQNYVTIFENPVFWQSVAQTLYFTIMSVVFHFIIGLAFALLLNTNRVDPLIRSILRVLFILPWLFTAVIIAIIWRLLLDPNGVVNSVLMALHIINFKVEWFSSTRTAIHALTFANIWAGYPLYMVSLLAGLQGISKELYEAAGIDGANGLQKFWYITIPQLMPIIISIALLDFIWTMQVFPLVWMTTGGGPIYSTEVLSTFTYKLAFSQYEFSLASASAMIILIISMSVTYFYIKHQQRR